LASKNQLSKFWSGARKYSNMLYNFEKGLDLTEFSSKLPPLLEKIKEFPVHKHYVYSAFYEKSRGGPGQGILTIAEQLDKEGYKKLTVKEAKALKGKTIAPGKRYILAIQSEIGEEGSSSAGKNLQELINIYNSSQNSDGSLIHVFLASQGFNEGLDLKAVRHIHIFEPLVTMASDLQTIGRARRYCSHADLDQKDWTVEIHRYFSDIPVTSGKNDTGERIEAASRKIEELKSESKSSKDKELKSENKEKIASLQKQLKMLTGTSKSADVQGIDMVIYKTAQARMRELFVTYHCLKEASVDCKLLHKFHNDDAIKCLE
jgi:hypothetical protein